MAGRLCEHTIKAEASSPGDPAYFEILDLSKDPRFNTLPFVAGEPHFRYYCGVPLMTKRGIPIGSLFAMDDKAKAPASKSMIACKQLSCSH
jgi:GAF domain-containing protein